MKLFAAHTISTAQTDSSHVPIWNYLLRIQSPQLRPVADRSLCETFCCAYDLRSSDWQQTYPYVKPFAANMISTAQASSSHIPMWKYLLHIWSPQLRPQLPNDPWCGHSKVNMYMLEPQLITLHELYLQGAIPLYQTKVQWELGQSCRIAQNI